MRKQGAQAADSWARSNFLVPRFLMALSMAKFQLLVDAKRSGLLREDAPVQEFMQTSQDAGSLFEEQRAPEEADFEIDDDSGWLDAIGKLDANAAENPVLPGLLCAAFPTNVAVRKKPGDSGHTTATLHRAIISPNSVNNPRDAKVIKSSEGRTWWLYNEVQLSGTTAYLRDTTKMRDWHVGLFGGLRILEGRSVSPNPKLELDGWLTVDGKEFGTCRLLRVIRHEFRQALVWQALAASYREPLAEREALIMKVLGAVLRGGKPSSDIKKLEELLAPKEDPNPTGAHPGLYVTRRAAKKPATAAP